MSRSMTFDSEFSPSDRLMWTIERDPVLRSPILVVGLLDRDPSWPAFRETFRRAVDRVPRLRQVVLRSPSGRLRWSDDRAFSLDYHLRRVRVPEPGDLRAVLDLAAPSATSALDPARPLWECTLVEGLLGGQAAFVFKFHHTITDGVGGIDLAGVVFDRKRRGAPVAASAGSDVDRALPRPNGEVAAVRYGLAGIKAMLDPVGSARRAVRLGRSVGRMLAPMPAPLSPVFQGRGLDRGLHSIERPLSDLRAGAAAAGVTVNDLFLAALGGGLHEYHQRLGYSVPELRVTMPISLRTAEDAAGGNHFTPARFVLPIDDPDPAVRARIVGNIAHRWQREPAVGLTDVLATVLDQLPAGLVTRFFGSMLKNIDVDAVDVPGLIRPAYVGGARIDRMWAFAPPTGAAISVTLLSHLDTVCVGVVSDLAAVPDPALLVECLEHGFDDALSLGAREPVGARS